jgi:hypothetical protein
MKNPATSLDAALAEHGRTRSGFDLSLPADWNDLTRGPEGMLTQWEAAGFTRVMLAASAPFPLGQFEQIARQSFA